MFNHDALVGARCGGFHELWASQALTAEALGWRSLSQARIASPAGSTIRSRCQTHPTGQISAVGKIPSRSTRG